VRRFINSVDLESEVEELADGETAGAWLADHGVTGGRFELSDEDLRGLIELRETLRDLAQANHEQTPDPGALERLAAIARTAPLLVGTDGNRIVLEPAHSGPATALARILAIVAAAQENGTWARMKACRRDTCRWAFYDHSKNRSGSWCSMAVCGNREKGQRFRVRHASA